MSAVVGGIVTAPWRAGKPCRRNACPQRCPQRLLTSPQLAYPAAGLAGAIIIDDEF